MAAAAPNARVMALEPSMAAAPVLAGVSEVGKRSAMSRADSRGRQADSKHSLPY